MTDKVAQGSDFTITQETKLIFLPGAGGDPAFWRGVGDRLPAGRDKVYLGWPGLGHETHDPAVRCLDDLVRLTEEVMGDGPVDLLAQSMGGIVALRVALRHPHQVQRLVLSTTSGGIDMSGMGASDWRVPYRAEYPHAAAWIYSAGGDLSAALPNLVQPTLLLWGDSDPISPVAVGERLNGLIPRSELEVIAGGAHDLVASRADEVAPVIEAFLA